MILVPGPVELHPRVLKAMSEQVISHRSEKFSELLMEIVNDLSWAIGAESEAKIALLTGSGTLAVESMVYSLVNPGDSVLALEFGEFGKRLRESLESRGANVFTIKAPPGRTPEASEIETIAKKIKPKYIATVHVETSTGTMINNLKDISKLAEEFGAKLLLDAVSSLGLEELYMNKWSINAIASCSQKGLGAPPGLSLVALSEEAVKRVCETTGKPSYLDLCKSLRFLEKRETPFTPAVNLMYGLAEALKLLREEGIEERWRRTKRLSELLYNMTEDIGFSPLAEETNRAHAVVALVPPNGFSATEIVKALRKKEIYIASGMGDLKDKILRIGIMGYVNESHVEKLVKEMAEIVGRKKLE
jgi:aspartate aminotransferase-like enzyme